MYKYLILLVSFTCYGMQDADKLATTDQPVFKILPLFEEPTILDYEELKDHVILLNHLKEEFKEELFKINERVELLEKLFGMTIVNLRKNKNE